VKERPNKETILIAEDDSFVRRAAARILERAGYNVLEAADGKEALQWVCSFHGHIDLLFTDVVMPQMDGRQLADIALALRPRMKVLYTSAFPDRMIVADGVIKSGAAFIAKSFNPEQLSRKIRDLLDASDAIYLKV